MNPSRVVIVGGGVAGLEALLALRALGGEHVELTLLAAQPDLVYRPLAVAEPFALGSQRHTPLSEATRAVGANFVEQAITAVEPNKQSVTLDNGDTLSYDALLLALGAASEPAFEHALTWDDRSGVETLAGLVRDLEEGYSRRLAIVIPPGPGWPLPGYELALLIARDARAMNVEPEITLVTPEQAPLAIFGSRAVEAVSQDLAQAGVRLELSAYAEIEQGNHRTLLLRPSQRRLAVDRVLSLPRLRGRAPRGIPANPDGFIGVDEHGRVTGVEHVWAAGDIIDFPVKFGGLAAEQADAAAADIAADAGAIVERKPFRPVLRGKLLTGWHAQRYLRYDAAGGGEGQISTTALWWPPGKIAGRWFAPWLGARDDQAIAGPLPTAGGLDVQTDLRREIYAS